MMRGTFANIRLRNAMAPGTGWLTCLQPSGEQMRIFAAAQRPLSPFSSGGDWGKEYGTGSSRDWAAKGVALLGVRQFWSKVLNVFIARTRWDGGIATIYGGQSATELGIDGTEIFNISQPQVGANEVKIDMIRADGSTEEFSVRVRIDTPKEWDYYCHGGILPYMVRQLLT